MSEKSEKSSTLEYDSAMANDYITPGSSATDDPHTPALTARVLFLGLIWGAFYAVVDTFFSFRTQRFLLPKVVMIILVLPMGHFLARVLPPGVLNPGVFSIKEHVLATILASSSGGLPHGIDMVVAHHSPRLIYTPNVTFWSSLAWVAINQLIGFGAAGFLIRYLVKPVAMFWYKYKFNKRPSLVSGLSLFTALNGVTTPSDRIQRYPISRLKIFWHIINNIRISGATMFLYQWIPAYFMTVLQSVAMMCLLTNNKTARFLGSAGPNAGVGMFAFTFDWTISDAEEGMNNPWWVTVNTTIGQISFEWILVPIFYYMNVFNQPALKSKYKYPDGQAFGILNSIQIFNGSGFPIKIGRPHGNDSFNTLLSPSFDLNNTKYDLHKPFYITEMNALNLFAEFSKISSSFIFIGLWYGKDIYRMMKHAYQRKKMGKGQSDVHNIIMNEYQDVPEWFWTVWLIIASVFAMVFCQFSAFYTPFWSSFLVIFIGVSSAFINGFLEATSGSKAGISLLADILMGYLMDGRTVPFLVFRSLESGVKTGATSLLKGMKVAHYIHISPIAVVSCQLLGLIVGIILNTVTTYYILDIMTEPKIFVNPSWNALKYAAFVNSGGMWGSIGNSYLMQGPARFFGRDSPYGVLFYGFMFGLILPLIPYLLNKVYPHKWWHLINPVQVMTGTPDIGSFRTQIIPKLVVGFIFQWYIFRYKREWFNKFVNITVQGIGFGAGIATLIASIILQIKHESPNNFYSAIKPRNMDYYCYDGSASLQSTNEISFGSNT